MKDKVTVIRRNGTQSPLDIEKIRKVVEWACADLEVNPISLESSFNTKLKNKITTREIQDNLIQCASNMTTEEEPDWRYVAGRLLIWGLWKDIFVNRECHYEDYPEVVRAKVANGQYDSRLLDYSRKELEEANSWINSDWDTDYDYAGATLLTKRYLLKDELPQEAFLTCSLLLAVNEPKDKRMDLAKSFYHLIATRKISLATPILANLRTPRGSLASCFITAMEDNLESIYHEITNTARISKNGGGVGVNVSRIRSLGSWVMGRDNASGGVLPWIKLINDTALAVNQGKQICPFGA